MISSKAKIRFEKKFLKKSNKECWEWLAGKLGKYGGFWYSGKTIIASRFSYMLYKGAIGNLDVCHTCDNPICVNPNHLFLGTAQENSQDSINKGRMIKGERVNTAKLTENDVRKIRKLFNEGYTKYRLGKMFNMSRTNIRRIIERIYWTHVE